MISDEIRELYNLGGKHQFLVCERCHQECTGTWEGICIDCMRKVPQNRRFIFLKAAYTSTSKFTRNQRDLIKNIIAMLSIKRIPEQEIIKAVFDQTNETISERYLYAVKQQIKSGP